MQNLQSKTPYKFKNSYGGTPEPQTAQDAPWLHGPSLKNSNLLSKKVTMTKFTIHHFLEIFSGRDSTYLQNQGAGSQQRVEVI